MTKVDPKALVTNEYLDDAVDKVVKGMDRIIEGLKADLSDTVSKRDFNNFKTKVGKFATS